MNNNTTTFNNAADLERMVQVGTGAMDSATPTSQNSRNQTASGMSMMQSGFIKRAKRTMNNIDTNFVQPFIHKAYWRYLQYDPQRFPAIDVKFEVKGSMGIMAREFEQSQLTALLSVVSQEHPAYQVLLKSIFENSSSPNKDEMLKAIEAANQPDPKQQQLQEAATQIELTKAAKEIEEIDSKILFNRARSEAVLIEASLEDERLEVDTMNAVAQQAQSRVSQIVQIIKAQKEARDDRASNTSNGGES